MATIQQTIRSVREQLGRDISEVEALIATYLCHGMSQLEIAETLGVEKEELSDLINSNEFQQIRQIIQLDLAKNKQDIDGGWDSVEARALQAVNEYIDVGINGVDEAIKLASIANKAERRGSKQNHAIGGQGGGILTLQLTQNFIGKIQSGRQQKELPVGSSQIINGEAIEMNESIHVEQGNGKVIENKTEEAERIERGQNQNDDREQNHNGMSLNATESLTSLANTQRPSPAELDSVLNLKDAIQNQGNSIKGGGLDDSVFKSTPGVISLEETLNAFDS